MTDPTTAVVAPTKPETWAQEAWDALVEAEQWVVSDLHEIGLVFANDVWPVIKSALSLLFSQLGSAALKAIMGSITDPALIPANVGAALLLTASTTGVADAKTALASAEAAVNADPSVQALLNPQTQTGG